MEEYIGGHARGDLINTLLAEAALIDIGLYEAGGDNSDRYAILVLELEVQSLKET